MSELKKLIEEENHRQADKLMKMRNVSAQELIDGIHKKEDIPLRQKPKKKGLLD